MFEILYVSVDRSASDLNKAPSFMYMWWKLFVQAFCASTVFQEINGRVCDSVQN
jgi:hypothetical protein